MPNGVYTPWHPSGSCIIFNTSSPQSPTLFAMKKTSFTIPPPPFAAIHARAYHLWQQANRPTGQDLDFWLQAEQQVQPQPQAGKAAAAKAPQNARTTSALAKPNPQAALTFKPKPGSKRAIKPPAH